MASSKNPQMMQQQKRHQQPHLLQHTHPSPLDVPVAHPRESSLKVQLASRAQQQQYGHTQHPKVSNSLTKASSSSEVDAMNSLSISTAPGNQSIHSSSYSNLPQLSSSMNGLAMSNHLAPKSPGTPNKALPPPNRPVIVPRPIDTIHQHTPTGTSSSPSLSQRKPPQLGAIPAPFHRPPPTPPSRPAPPPRHSALTNNRQQESSPSIGTTGSNPLPPLRQEKQAVQAETAPQPQAKPAPPAPPKADAIPQDKTPSKRKERMSRMTEAQLMEKLSTFCLFIDIY